MTVDIKNKLIENHNQRVKSIIPASIKQEVQKTNITSSNFNQLLILTNIIENGQLSEASLSLLKELDITNKNNLKYFDMRLLDNSYISDFNTQFLKDIGMFPELSSKLVSLKEHNSNLYDIYVSIINDMEGDNSLGNFYLKSKTILNYLFDNQYSLKNMNKNNIDITELVNYILFYNSDTAYLSKIEVDLSSSFTEDFINECDNIFEKEYQRIKILNSNGVNADLNQIKSLYFQKYFSITLEEAQDLFYKYGEHITELSESASSNDLFITMSFIGNILKSEDVEFINSIYINQDFRFSKEEILKIDEIGRHEFAETY